MGALAAVLEGGAFRRSSSFARRFDARFFASFCFSEDMLCYTTARLLISSLMIDLLLLGPFTMWVVVAGARWCADHFFLSRLSLFLLINILESHKDQHDYY